MSLEEGSMAAQGTGVTDGEASSSSSPQGISFVKFIDRKARSYLKTLERSFSFSVTESKGEDPSTMTIEFLRARLQAQRAEYRAEKQRSQLLAKKVLELEQRLSFEIEQRKKGEGNNMQVISSSSYRGGHPSSRLKHAHSYSGRDLVDSKLKDKASGEDDPSDWCLKVFGNEGHPDRDGVFLISPSLLWHRRESLRRERQQKVDQHAISQFNDGINAAAGSDKESFTMSHRDRPSEATSCGELALSMEVLDDIADEESGKFQTNRQESALYDANKSLKFDCSQQHTHASPIDSCCQNYQVKLSQSSIHPLAKMVSSNLSLQRGMHVSVESYAQRPTKFANLPPMSKTVCVGHDKIFDYIAPHSNTTKTMQEEAASRNLSNDESRSTYTKEVLYSEGIRDNEISTYRPSSQQVHMQKANTTFKTCRSFSDVETRYARKLHRHRMSLDGGLDRLQKVGKDDESAKF